MITNEFTPLEAKKEKNNRPMPKNSVPLTGFIAKIERRWNSIVK